MSDHKISTSSFLRTFIHKSFSFFQFIYYFLLQIRQNSFLPYYDRSRFNSAIVSNIFGTTAVNCDRANE